MTRADDLVPLLTQQPGDNVRFRQGTVISWNQLTAENVVEVGGALLTNLPILNTTESTLLSQGDVVGLLSTGEGAKSYWILGRITVPNTPQATSAYSALLSRVRIGIGASAIQRSGGTLNNYVSASGIQSGAAEAIATDILIGASGACLVITSCDTSISPSTSSSSGSFDIYTAPRLTHETLGVITGPSDGNALISHTGWEGATLSTNGGASASRVDTYLDLPPGRYTAQLFYRTLGGSALWTWFHPTITVIPL